MPANMICSYFDNFAKYVEKYGEKFILLWQSGSFYEVYGLKNKETGKIYGTIEQYEKILDLHVSEKMQNISWGKYKNHKLLLAGYGTCKPLEKYLDKLNNAGYTVGVWVECGDDISGKGKLRKEMGIFSVGTNFDINTDNMSNNIVCVWIETFKTSLISKKPKIYFGLSSIDIFTGKVNLYQYCFESNKIHEPCVFDDFERFISIYKPKELIIIHNYEKNEIISDIMQFIGLHNVKLHTINLNNKLNKNTQIAENCEKQKYHKEVLSKTYKFSDFHSFYNTLGFSENIFSTQSFIYLLYFLNKHNENLVLKIEEPIYDKNSKNVLLATHSLKQLNIIETNENKSCYSSVSKLLDKCVTRMGSRLLREKLLNPVYNVEHLNKEYKLTEFILNNYDKFLLIRKKINSLKDIERLERKMILKKIQPAEITQIYYNFVILKEIYNEIKELDINEYLNEKIGENLEKNCDNVINFIEKFINFEKAKNINKITESNNFFNKNIFKELDDFDMKDIENQQKLKQIQEFFCDVIGQKEKKKKYDFVKIHSTLKSGKWLQGTSKRCQLLKIAFEKHKVKKYNLKYKSNYDGKEKDFIFSSENLKFVKTTQNNKKIMSITLNDLYDSDFQNSSILYEIIIQCYKEFINDFTKLYDDINIIVKFASMLDFVITKAYLARNYNYCKPKIIEKNNESFLDIKSIRHPLIERINENDEEMYQTNDIFLGKDNTDGILLYGTNAVGKSSLIKAMGINTIMAQSGFYVSCKEFNYYPYKTICTRILGNDNIFKKLSSFQVEMSELKTILKLSNKNSLILGDELCSGTENKSAICIFIASLLKLYESKSSYIFATHFHQLYEEEIITNIDTLKMKHLSVTYNDFDDSMIYNRKLMDGPGRNMYGIEVCKSMGLPSDVMETIYNTRRNIFPEDNHILENKSSRYNNRKLKDSCEFCGGKGEEIHHLIPQKDADERGMIEHFNKNQKFNLANVCKKCHKIFTKNNIKHERKKTTNGTVLIQIN